MDKTYSVISRLEGESLVSYDNRINELGAQHIGYAFFRSVNYNANTHEFSVYVVWNGIFNNALNDPMPDGGFVIHCSEKEAMKLCRVNAGIKVFSRLYSCEGRLTARDMIVAFDDKKYILSFTGVSVAKPEQVYFMDVDNSSIDEACEDASPFIGDFETNRKLKEAGSFNLSSFKMGSFNLGSFKSGSFKIGSFNIGSFSAGSFSVSSYNVGSFNLGSFNVGTFRTGSFTVGSYSIGSFNLGSYGTGSFNIGSFMSGSYSASSFNSGSFKSMMNAGSFNLGSYNSSSFTTWYIGTGSYYGDAFAGKQEAFPFEELLREIFGIGKMGYGLNLLN